MEIDRSNKDRNARLTATAARVGYAGATCSKCLSAMTSAAWANGPGRMHLEPVFIKCKKTKVTGRAGSKMSEDLAVQSTSDKKLGCGTRTATTMAMHWWLIKWMVRMTTRPTATARDRDLEPDDGTTGRQAHRQTTDANVASSARYTQPTRVQGCLLRARIRCGDHDAPMTPRSAAVLSECTAAGEPQPRAKREG